MEERNIFPQLKIKVANHTRRRLRLGFTLIELLVVIAIIALLMAAMDEKFQGLLRWCRLRCLLRYRC